jgi:hypothetical protein
MYINMPRLLTTGGDEDGVGTKKRCVLYQIDVLSYLNLLMVKRVLATKSLHSKI